MRWILSGTILLFLIGFANCNKVEESTDAAATAAAGETTEDDTKSTSDTETPKTETTAAGTLAISTNALAGAYPEGLTINPFPQAIDSDPGTSAPGTIAISLNEASTKPSALKSNKEKLKDALDRLNGKGDCFEPNILQRYFFQRHATEFCYGTGYGIVSGTAIGTGDAGSINPALDSIGTGDSATAKDLLVGVNGFEAETNGEVCMVAVARNNIQDSTNQLDVSLELIQGILCQAQKKGVDALPGIDESPLDLSDEIKTALPPMHNSTITIDSVTLKRLADKGGDPVYKTAIEFAKVGEATAEVYESLVLVHSPSSKGNGNHKGTILLKGTRTEGHKVSRVAKSLTYKKITGDGSQRLIFDIRAAHFPYSDHFNKDSEVFTEGRVNFAAADSAALLEMGPALANTVENIVYVVFDVDPTSNAGKIGSWNAAGGAAGGFVFKTEQNPTSGIISGCAWAGDDRQTTIAKRLAQGEAIRPTGCFTDLIRHGDCGTPGDNAGSQIWQQCFAQNDQGIYVVDAEKTTDAKQYSVVEAANTDVPLITIQIDGVPEP